MSKVMDIRSFFAPKKPLKPKVEDDDDVIPESPEVKIQTKKTRSRNKRVLSDSDDEIFDTKKKKLAEGSKSSVKSKNKATVKPVLKETKVADLFGSAPIKRTESFVTKKKKTETGIHSDDEFDKSLLELDEAEVLGSDLKTYTNHTEKDKNHEIKENGKAETVSNLQIKEHEQPEKGSNHENKEHRNFEKSKTNKLTTQSVDTVNKSSSDTKDDVVNGITKIKKEKVDFSQFICKKSKDDSKHEDQIKNEKLDTSDNKKLNGSIIETKEKKRDLNESVSEDRETKSKKRKLSLNESMLTDEERYERQMRARASYKNFCNRPGPKHLGAKEIPKGSPNCLSDCAILITGVLDSFEREEIIEAIKTYGGSVKSSISKKVTHLLAGNDAGEAKLAKAQELNIKIINEDEFLQMIIEKSETNSHKNFNDVKKEKSPARINKEKSPIKSHRDKKSHEKQTKNSSSKEKVTEPETKKNGIKKEISDGFNSSSMKVEDLPLVENKQSTIQTEKSIELKKEINGTTGDSNTISSNSMLWVEKHKPQSIKYIIGQHGEASNVKKLMNWLTKWYANRKAKLPKPNPWAKNDDGGYFKAALLSGPPGVGKTTTVSLVCKELGFDMVEFNASDTRNRTLIKEQIGELLTTNSLSGYAKGETGKQAVSKKHVLVMDEVDGMAGNEDRGGLQELILLIKSTSVPIICMCNDRNSQKMRSFVNYCYDLRFNKPKVDQIKSAMMSVCFKEGIKIPPDVLSQLIVSANQDVRQTLHLLSMWAADPSIADIERLRTDAKGSKKDIKLGPWEAVRKVFTQEEHKNMTINDRSDLFFYDYSLAPLFVQENYLSVAPHCPKNKVLERISEAADSISMGDLVDARIRSNQAWSLLPLQAMYSSVIPGHHMAGHVAGQIQFPGWLGKNSRATKMQRLCQELHAHTRLSTSGSKSSISLDYASHLRDAIITPLINDKNDGIPKSLEVLEAYHLLREDLDSLTELSLWPGQRNPTILIDSKVKAAMTRTYNKSASALPYAPASIRRGKAKTDDDMEDEVAEVDIEEEPEDSDPENDALIKKKKNKEVENPSTSKEKPSTSKGKGKKKK